MLTANGIVKICGFEEFRILFEEVLHEQDICFSAMITYWSKELTKTVYKLGILDNPEYSFNDNPGYSFNTDVWYVYVIVNLGN